MRGIIRLMENIDIAKIKEAAAALAPIKLFYIFGSRARREAGVLSDFDFAIYLDENDKIKMRDIQFELSAKIAKILKTDRVDIVVLNLTNNPSLKYNIVKDGQLILEKEPYKIIIEPRILNEYFDFQMELKKFNLTKAI